MLWPPPLVAVSVVAAVDDDDAKGASGGVIHSNPNTEAPATAAADEDGIACTKLLPSPVAADAVASVAADAVAAVGGGEMSDTGDEANAAGPGAPVDIVVTAVAVVVFMCEAVALVMLLALL